MWEGMTFFMEKNTVQYAQNVLEQILTEKNIKEVFQPIVSVSRRALIGVEALARPHYRNQPLPPYWLLLKAQEQGLSAQVDKMLLELALHEFPSAMGVPALFLNCGMDFLHADMQAGENAFLPEAVRQSGLPSQSVFLELSEQTIEKAGSVRTVAGWIRKQGFMLALDDVTGGSRLSHMMELRPDAVKIDRSLISGIHKSTYSQEIVKSIIHMAHNAGAFVVVMGTGTRQEVMTCMALGADFFQGFYFSSPKPAGELQRASLSIQLEEVASSHQAWLEEQTRAYTDNREQYLSLLADLMGQLRYMDMSQYEELLFYFVKERRQVSCAYLLDEEGFQITSTVMLPEVFQNRRSTLFGPAPKGANHALKHYFYAVREKMEDPFLSDWYISSATGHHCRTASTKFVTKKGEVVYVCIDIAPQQHGVSL